VIIWFSDIITRYFPMLMSFYIRTFLISYVSRLIILSGIFIDVATTYTKTAFMRMYPKPNTISSLSVVELAIYCTYAALNLSRINPEQDLNLCAWWVPRAIWIHSRHFVRLLRSLATQEKSLWLLWLLKELSCWWGYFSL